MILITGGTGVMGSVLVRRLAAKGEKIRVLALPGDPHTDRVEGVGAEVRYGDIARPEQLRGVCEGVSVVYHLAGVILSFDESRFDTINTDGTRNLLQESRRAGVKHFIYISSASVVYPEPTRYLLSKRAAESAVRKSGIPFTIVRPTLVYAPSRGAEELDLFLDYLRRFPVVPFVGDGKAMKRPVYVEDLIEGLSAIHGNEASRGRIYNLSGGESISIGRFARLCLRLLGMPRKPIVHLPVWLCWTIARAMALAMKQPPLRRQVIVGMTRDADLDPSQAMEDLGYRPHKVSEMLPRCFPRR